MHTHFRTYFSGWIESDVHWGLTDLGFDPCPHGSTCAVVKPLYFGHPPNLIVGNKASRGSQDHGPYFESVDHRLTRIDRPPVCQYGGVVLQKWSESPLNPGRSTLIFKFINSGVSIRGQQYLLVPNDLPGVGNEPVWGYPNKGMVVYGFSSGVISCLRAPA